MPASRRITQSVAAKMMRLELLKTKAELERGLEEFLLTCGDCGRNVHWVSGLGNAPGHWSHAEPAPHGALPWNSQRLLIDLEREPAAKAVIWGLPREMERR
jgi:hypothetical protein